ncbi:MAG: acetate--CoA ligase family protein [Anaerolineae bacterium]|jgi:acetyltransferase|nr:acetate--CoA ligase family protein [Anaerolineae bacterium]
MREFFYPSSVAVIGVSAKPTNLGRNIVANLVEYDFNGIVYAVGPSGGAIETRRIYHSVLDIPDHVDLAVVFTPAHTVPAILEQCGQKGIPRAIIETAGFREYTEEGRQLEDQICEISRRYGIHFIGPNCIGAINMENGFCVPFPRLSRFVKRGEVSIITQSGGVGMSVLNLLANEGLGLNKFVSVGNMLDKTAEDLLEYLIEDDQTGLIFLYLESIGDGRRLMEIARRSEKPILAFKSNIGRLGQKIALSHTASLTSDDRVVDAAFHQAGVARVRDATTLGNNLKIMRLPAMKGRNLGVISRSGGHAVIAADACELSGFELAEFPDEFLREIEKHFRASVIRLTNPLDLGDLFDLDVYADIIERTLQLEGVDGIVFLHTSLSEEENLTSRLLLDRIMELAAKYNKPVAYFISAASQEVAYLKQNYSYPIFTQVVETVRALEISHYRYQQYQRVHTTEPLPKFVVDREPTRRRLEQAQAERRDLLLSEALLTLEDYGIRAAPSRAARTRADAERAAAELGYPVAIKIISAQISHKTDVGGVQLNLRSAEELGAAYDDMLARLRQADPTAQLESVLVQPMVSRGRELILGGRQDPQFGPVVLVGLGGIFVELFNDISVRVAPITHSAAVEMLENLHSFRMLKGARGQPPADIEALVDAILRLAQLLCDFPEIKEIDLNPLRLFDEGEGLQALDARMILGG